MPVKDALYAPGGSLEIGTDSEASPPPYHWFVTADFKKSPTAPGGFKQWGPLNEEQARETYAALLPAFQAMADAAEATVKAVAKLPRVTTTDEGYRRLYYPPEPVTGGPIQNSVDYSRQWTVLAKEGSKEIWWMKSGKWGNGMYPEALPTELRVVDRGKGRGKRLGPGGGRLTAKRLDNATLDINEFFGWEITEYLVPGKTLLVTTPETIQEEA